MNHNIAALIRLLKILFLNSLLVGPFMLLLLPLVLGIVFCIEALVRESHQENLKAALMFVYLIGSMFSANAIAQNMIEDEQGPIAATRAFFRDLLWLFSELPGIRQLFWRR